MGANKSFMWGTTVASTSNLRRAFHLQEENIFMIIQGKSGWEKQFGSTAKWEEKQCEVSIARRERYLSFKLCSLSLSKQRPSHFIIQVQDTWIQSIFNGFHNCLMNFYSPQKLRSILDYFISWRKSLTHDCLFFKITFFKFNKLWRVCEGKKCIQ